MKNSYTTEETGVMLYAMPNGSFDLCMAWIGNSFRVVVKNATSNEIIYLRTYHFQNAIQFKDAATELKSIVATDVLFADTYRTIKIGLAYRAELFPSTHYNKPATDFLSKKLNGNDITIAAPIAHSEMEFYAAFFPKASFELLASNWMELILPNADIDTLFIHVSHHTLWIAHTAHHAKLNFFSTFEFKTAEDFAYYTNLVAVELGLDRTKIGVVLSGDLSADSALQKMAYTYFHQVRFMENSKNTFSRLFDAYPKHQNIDLFSL